MTKRKLWALILVSVMVLLLWRSAVAAEAVRRGLTLCARSVIPALFPYFVVSGLFISLGFADGVGRRLEPLTRRLFGVSGAGASAFFLGLLGGYPVGGRTVGQLYRAGRLSKDEAERLLAFCNNAGPSFILGIVGVGCFGSLRTGIYLYLVHAFSAVLVGILFRKKAPVSGQKFRYSAAFEPIAAFVRAVGEAAEGMVRLCGFVVFFLVILALITDLTGLNHPVLLGLAELTTGVTALEGRPGDLVWAAALLGWGGLSVHGQTAAVLSDTDLGLGRYFLGKILQAIFSAGVVTFGEIW